jgi:putative transposase
MNAHASLSAYEIHDYAKSVIQRYLKFQDFSPRCTSSVIIAVLLYAAARITSLSDACARLREAPSDETLRQALLATIPGLVPLQRQLNAALSGDLPKTFRKQAHPIAIDTHEIPYHGEPMKERREIRRSKPRRGTTHFHSYATAYVVRKGYRFTIAMTWVRQDDSPADVVKRLLQQVRKIGVKVQFVLLDRGFYNAGVVRYLQAARTAFLMPMKAYGRLPKDPRKASRGARRFFKQKASGWDRYTWLDKKGLRATVQVCICCGNHAGRKKKRGRYALVYAYWRLRPGSIQWIRQTYRKRFGIETSYRQMERARIRTSSRDPLRRLLFAGIALILRNIWVWLHLMRLSARHGDVVTLHLTSLRFTTLLLHLQTLVERQFDADYCTNSQTISPITFVTKLNNGNFWNY